MEQKLIKLLQLSQSPNDHEALAAVRLANSILQKNNLDWEGFFKHQLRDRQRVVMYSQAGGSYGVSFTVSAYR